MLPNDPSKISRPSATVVVAREGNLVPELLLVRRRAGDAFGNSFTFPGGVIDPDETAAHAFCSGLAAAEACRQLGLAENGLDYFSAAIRELFEETGILLARRHDGSWAPDHTAFGGLRLQVDKAEISWAAFLREQSLCMAADALHYFAWWETPAVMPKRWTTRFFLAELPSGQTASHDGCEIVDHCWLTAGDALARGKNGELPMPFPTSRTLESLQQFQTVGSLIGWARQLPKSGISRIEPSVVTRNGEKQPVIPGDPGYKAEGHS